MQYPVCHGDLEGRSRNGCDHVLEETLDTTFASDSKAGKITWTAQFENGIFTTQTRSADAEPVCEDTTVTHPAPVPTGDDANPALWYTLLAEALACLAAVFTLHRRMHHTVGILADREDSDCRR